MTPRQSWSIAFVGDLPYLGRVKNDIFCVMNAGSSVKTRFQDSGRRNGIVFPIGTQDIMLKNITFEVLTGKKFICW